MRARSLIAPAVVIGIVALYFHSCVEPFPFDISTASPGDTYRVRLKEAAEVYLSPFNLLSNHGNHEVRFSVDKDGGPLVENEFLYGGDGLDSRFMDAYPKRDWEADNILRFGRNFPSSSVEHDEVSVINETSSAVQYLVINAGDRYLLLELQPQTSTKFSATAQTDKHADISYVSCFGKFDNDKKIPETGANFGVYGEQVSPTHYCIFIREDGAIIRSGEFEGFDVDESGKIVKLPDMKNTSCRQEDNARD